MAENQKTGQVGNNIYSHRKKLQVLVIIESNQVVAKAEDHPSYIEEFDISHGQVFGIVED